MLILRWMILTYVLSVLCGCDSIPIASKSSDQEAKMFRASSDVATVYVFREGFVNSLNATKLVVDQKYAVGKIRPGNYLWFKLPAGVHEFTCETDTEKSLRADLKSGQIYFFELSAPFKLFSSGAEIRTVSESDGRKAVLDSEMAKTRQP